MADGAALYTVTPGGQAACRLCYAVDYRHTRECPVIVLRLQLRELGAQLGLYVATMRDTIDTLDQLLRGPDVPPTETS